jgi:hypothetical protein
MPENAFRTENPRVDGGRAGALGSSPEPWHLRLVRELAIQDWIVLVYLTILMLAVSAADDSLARTRCLGHLAPMLAFCAAVLALVRGGLVKDNFVAPLTYRIAVYGTVQIS